MDDLEKAAHERLRKIREKEDISLKPSRFLRTTVRALDESEVPFRLRNYQKQMVIHLQVMRRFIVGDDTGLGKTLETIAALAIVFEREPNAKVVVLARKSAVLQWRDEILKFTQGVGVIVARGTAKERKAAYKQWDKGKGPTILVAGYRSIVKDFTITQDWKPEVFVLDEAQTFKTPTSQVHAVCRHIASQSNRVWGLTATLIKNNLVEGYGIYKVVHPPLFTHSPTNFMRDYCIVEMRPIGRGRKVPIIVGVRKVDIERFRDKIEPYYLGRPKHAVTTELPLITQKIIEVDMSAAQHLKYQEALNGILGMGNGEEKEVTPLTAVTYCQEIVNHLGLIGHDGDSDKLDTLVDMMTEGDLSGKKVVVYTKFERMVGIGIRALEAAGVKCVRITGKETKDETRKAAQDTFQDPRSDIRCIWITNAGNESINLQQAEAIVYYDIPYSAGDDLQTLGRIVRIGSPHDRVFLIRLVVKNSIDERVLDIRNKKMKILEAVLGKRILGDDDPSTIGVESDVGAVFDALRRDARKAGGVLD